MKPTRFEGAEKCIQTIFGLKVSYGLLLMKFKFDYSTLSKKKAVHFLSYFCTVPVICSQVSVVRSQTSTCCFLPQIKGDYKN